MRVMITAAGTVTAQSLLKAFRADRRSHFIVAGDMDVLNATRAFSDEFVTLPRADDPSFSAECLRAANLYQIELLVPFIVEREFLPLAAAKEAFAKIGCRVLIPDEAIIRSIADKLMFAEFLSSIDVKGPATWAYSPDLQPAFPVYVKPRWGSGSVGAQVVSSSSALREVGSSREDLIVQELVRGREFTVDCFASEPGRVVAAVPRERIAIKAGVSVKGITHGDAGIESVASRVVEKSGLIGPANVQGILSDKGEFTVIEMNPRFSGTLALTTASGINFAELLVDLCEGKKIENMRGRHRAGVAMSRFWQEVFYEDGKVKVGEISVPDKIRNSAGANGSTV